MDNEINIELSISRTERDLQLLKHELNEIKKELSTDILEYIINDKKIKLEQVDKDALKQEYKFTGTGSDKEDDIFNYDINEYLITMSIEDIKIIMNMINNKYNEDEYSNHEVELINKISEQLNEIKL